MRNFKGGISDLSRLFAEDCTKQSLLGGKLGFALGRNFTYKYIAGSYASFAAAKKALSKLKKLYKGAFIIKMRDGVRLK